MLMLARTCSRLSLPFRLNMTSVGFRGLASENRARLPKEAGSIRLTELESQICSLLNDFTQVLGKNNQTVECCIAGGWVRDKVNIIVLSMGWIFDIEMNKVTGFGE